MSGSSDAGLILPYHSLRHLTPRRLLILCLANPSLVLSNCLPIVLLLRSVILSEAKNPHLQPFSS